MHGWDAGQYLRFAGERTRSAFDLLARIDLAAPRRIVQIVDSIDRMIEWLRGTGLRPFLARLDAAEQPIFVERYKALLADAMPPRPDGKRLLPYPRLFFIATPNAGS